MLRTILFPNVQLVFRIELCTFQLCPANESVVVFVRDAPVAGKNSEETRRDEFSFDRNVSWENCLVYLGREGAREGGRRRRVRNVCARYRGFFSDDRSEIESVHV